MKLRDAACEYADRGWRVLPVRPLSKRPHGLVPNGLTQATSDLATVFRWWEKAPDASIGIVAAPSGLLVIDVDGYAGGGDSLVTLERELGPLPETVSVATGSGDGHHYYFKHPGVPLGGKLGEGVDLRDNAYVIAPPSLHQSGRRYEPDNHPDDTPVAELPQKWLERMFVANRTKSEISLATQHHQDPLRNIPAETYVAKLTGRQLQRGGLFCCPFHANGEEWEPSLKVDGTMWACHGCPPVLGMKALGGNIFTFAALLAGYPIPPRGVDFLDVEFRLRRFFRV